MTPEYRAGLSEDDGKLYDELISLIDEYVHDSIILHKQDNHDCESFYHCHNKMLEVFVVELNEHLNDPKEINGAKELGFNTTKDMIEIIYRHKCAHLRDDLLQLAAVNRKRRELNKVS